MLRNGLENEQEDDDDEVKEWEMQHIHDGQRSEMIRSDFSMISTFANESMVALKSMIFLDLISFDFYSPKYHCYSIRNRYSIRYHFSN